MTLPYVWLLQKIQTRAIFLDDDTDPYTDGSDVGESYGQTPGILDQYIGNENYDVGHSFIAFCGGGTVGIGGGRACNENTNTGRYKGLGISCQFENNNAFAVELVAHEVGHQLSASHTFNNCEGNEENAVPGSAYEPGVVVRLCPTLVLVVHRLYNSVLMTIIMELM